MATASTFARGYNSFSGVDIKATIGSRAIGTLQGISYQISREKAPIYTMGTPDPRAFARGKRAIAGSLIFIQFDAEPLMYELTGPEVSDTAKAKFLADIDEMHPEFESSFAAEDVSVTEAEIGPVGETVVQPATPAADQESDVTSAGSDQKIATPWYPDQILPFDVILTAANEYGALAIMKILGVELLNNGSGVSIDDIVCEHSYTYIARMIYPWTAQGNKLAAAGVYGP